MSCESVLAGQRWQGKVVINGENTENWGVSRQLLPPPDVSVYGATVHCFGPDTGRGVFLTIMTWRLLQAGEVGDCKAVQKSALVVSFHTFQQSCNLLSWKAVMSEIWLIFCRPEPTTSLRRDENLWDVGHEAST
ncbi:hypothetical protein AK812_SmicGene14803 [Symbiodinium microadriaticum]|uniref:Uncharacterized protein n=1 Tax=Symbiodinium microadriaticum TaxID=2951 RepID=A0A1Q9E4M3_SYMMI|nr:hypothetical protein AK812_SmicGene14803 [Symbiodinium microadriaticum]